VTTHSASSHLDASGNKCKAFVDKISNSSDCSLFIGQNKMQTCIYRPDGFSICLLASTRDIVTSLETKGAVGLWF
jgi:hypothetical protein